MPPTKTNAPETPGERLLVRRRELQQLDSDSDQARNPVTLDQTSVGRLSRMDAMQGQAMAEATHQRRLAELRRIDAALRRLEHGDYGQCLACEEPIPEARLAFDPTATLCIACAEARERQR
jgi:DnaK suppressor protein